MADDNAAQSMEDQKMGTSIAATSPNKLADDDMVDVGPGPGDTVDDVVYDADIEVEEEDAGASEAADEGPDDAVHVFRHHTAESLAVHCNPTDQTMVATGGCDDRAILYDVARRRDLSELDGQEESVSCVQFSNDGKYLAAGSENGAISVMFLQGAAAPQSVLDGPAEAITFLSWHPRGPVLLAGSEDKSAYMWNAAKGTFMMAFVGHEDAVTCGFFSGDGKRVITASKDASIRVWNPTTGVTAVRLQANLPGIGGTFHTTAIHALACGFVDTPQAAMAVSGADDGTLYVSNLSSSSVVAQLPTHRGGVESLAFSPPSYKPHMLASAGADGIVRVRDMDNGVERCSFEHTGVISKVLWHSSKPVLVSGSSEGTICVWNVLTNVKLAELRGHKDFITDLCFACDEQALVSTSGDSTVRVFDVRALLP